MTWWPEAEAPEPEDGPDTMRSRVLVSSQIAEVDPVKHWVLDGCWPKGYSQSGPYMAQSNPPLKKRSESAMSYTSTPAVEENISSVAYSPEYEEMLMTVGIFMHSDPAIIKPTKASENLRLSLRSASYEVPRHSLFCQPQFRQIMQRAATKKARIERDITPEFIPSPEHLFFRGEATNVEHVTEELRGLWSKCMVLAGPTPTPDLAIGLRSSAFTMVELQKMRTYSTPERPTAFRHNLYFPFLVTEVKSGAALGIADRQNAHSAGMAVNAIFQLFRTVSRQKEIDKTILAFSLSHNHTVVKIYGHFPLVHGNNDRPSIHRRIIHNRDTWDEDDDDRWSSYNIIRKIYDELLPQHLERIRSAVANLPDPVPESTPSIPTHEALSVDAPPVEAPQGTATVDTSPPNNGTFKKPKLTPTVLLREELG
ncbi:MAG: hypothetical protein M1815_004991 [Lichina confinis]|nr:MAG: hypothetical protein M1815_004991 [Lichina confinis]